MYVLVLTVFRSRWQNDKLKTSVLHCKHFLLSDLAGWQFSDKTREGVRSLWKNLTLENKGLSRRLFARLLLKAKKGSPFSGETLFLNSTLEDWESGSVWGSVSSVSLLLRLLWGFCYMAYFKFCPVSENPEVLYRWLLLVIPKVGLFLKHLSEVDSRSTGGT